MKELRPIAPEIEAINDLANEFLQNKNFKQAYQLFKSINTHKLSISEINKLRAKNKKDKDYYPPKIGMLFAEALLAMDENNLQRMQECIKEAKETLLENPIDLPQPITLHSRKFLTNHASLTLRRFIRINGHLIFIDNNQPFEIKNQHCNVKICFNQNGELLIKSSDERIELHFEDNFQTNKIIMECDNANVTISGSIANGLNNITTNAKSLTIKSTVTSRHFNIMAPRSNVILDNTSGFICEELRISAAKCHNKSTHQSNIIMWHADEIELDHNSNINANKLHFKSKILKNGGRIYCHQWGALHSDDIYFHGLGEFYSDNGAFIYANNLMLNDKSSVKAPNKEFYVTKTLVAEKNTHITHTGNHTTPSRLVIEGQTAATKFYGSLIDDVIDINSDEFFNYENSRIFAEKLLKIETNSYGDAGHLSASVSGDIDIKVHGIYIDGVTNLDDIYNRLRSPEKLTNRTLKLAKNIKIVAPFGLEFMKNIVADNYHFISLVNFEILNTKNISNGKYSHVYRGQLGNFPNIRDMLNDIKKHMANFSQSNLSSSLSALKEKITFENIGAFLFFVVRRIPGLPSTLANLCYSLYYLFKNAHQFKNACIALYEKYKKGIEIKLAEILETFEPLIAAIPQGISVVQNTESAYTQIVDSIDHGLLAQLYAIDIDKKLTLEEKGQLGRNIFCNYFNNLLAEGTPDAKGVASIAMDAASTFLPNEVENSIASTSMNLFELNGRKIKYVLFNDDETPVDFVVNESDNCLIEKFSGRKVAKSIYKTAALRLDVRDLKFIGQNVHLQAPDLRHDESTHVDAEQLSLETKQEDADDFLDEKNSFAHMHSSDKSLKTTNSLTLSKEHKMDGNVRLISEGDVEVKEDLEAKSTTLSSTQGEARVLASIHSKGNNSISAKKDVAFKSKQKTEKKEDAAHGMFPKTTTTTTQQKHKIESAEGSNFVQSGKDITAEATDFVAAKDNLLQAENDVVIDGQKTTTRTEQSFFLGIPVYTSDVKEEFKPVTMQAGGRTNVAAGRDAKLTDVNMNSDKTAIEVDRDAKITASNLNGQTDMRVIAGRDIENTCRVTQLPNPVGGTKAKFTDSNITSTSGHVTTHAFRNLYSNGNIFGATGADAKGDADVLLESLTDTFVSENSHKSSWLGLVEKEKTKTSTQVKQTTVGSSSGLTNIVSDQGKTTLRGINLYSPDGAFTHGDQGTFTPELIVTNTTHEKTSVLGGILYQGEKSESAQTDIPTQLYTNGPSEFSASHNGIHLRSINMWGNGDVTLYAPGQQVELSAPILNNTARYEKSGFGFSIECPLLDEAKAIAAEARALVDSRSLPESALNAATAGVDTVNALDATKKMKQGLSEAKSLRQGMQASPIYARVSYGYEDSELHQQIKGQGSCSVHRLDVVAQDFDVTNGFSVDVDEATIHAKNTNLGGASLTSSVQQHNGSVSLNLSVNGVTGGDVGLGHASGETKYHQPEKFTAGTLNIDSDTLALKNAELNVGKVQGHVHTIDCQSEADTTKQKSQGINLGTSAAGITDSSAEASTTPLSHFQAQDASDFEVDEVNLNGGTFKALGAHVGSMSETPVHDHTESGGFGIEVNYHGFDSKDDAPISVPVRGHYQQNLLDTQQDSTGSHVLKDEHTNFNFVLPVFHYDTPPPVVKEDDLLNLISPAEVSESEKKEDEKLVLPEKSELKKSDEMNFSEIRIDNLSVVYDPLSYDSEAELSSVLSSFCDSKLISEEKTSESATHSKLPIQNAYAEIGLYGKSILSGASEAVKDTVMTPLSFLSDLTLLAMGNLQNNQSRYLPMHIDSSAYDDAAERMYERGENFESFMGSLADLAIRGGLNGMWTFIPNRPLLSTEQQAIDRGVQGWATYIDSYSYLSGPQLVKAVSYDLTSLLIAPTIFKAGKYISNEYRFGCSFNPPLYHNLHIDSFGVQPTLMTLEEIRAVPDFKKYIYTSNSNGKLLIAAEDFNSAFYHPDLCGGSPVLAAGEIRTVAGKIIFLNNRSGHYIPRGEHLATLTERVFKRNGFYEVKGMFTSLDDYEKRRGLPEGPLPKLEEIIDNMLPIYSLGGLNAYLSHSHTITHNNHSSHPLNHEDQYAISAPGLMGTSTKVTLLKIIKSMDDEIRSIRILGKVTKAELYLEMANRAISADDHKRTSHVEKVAQVGARFIATSRCTGHAFSFFKSIPVIGQSPLSILAFPAIFIGCSNVAGDSAEKMVTIASLEDEAYQQTMMNF